jgi:hypothetical protein
MGDLDIEVPMTKLPDGGYRWRRGTMTVFSISKEDVMLKL